MTRIRYVKLPDGSHKSVQTFLTRAGDAARVVLTENSFTILVNDQFHVGSAAKNVIAAKQQAKSALLALGVKFQSEVRTREKGEMESLGMGFSGSN